MRNRGGRGAVLLVTENIPTPANMMIAKGLGAELVRLDDFRPGLLEADPSLVIDINLKQLDNVRKLKGALVRRGHGCRVFLVDPGTRVAVVHANVLGADSLLPRHATVAQMNAAIQKHFGDQNSALDDKDVVQSIDAGVKALDESFNALTSNALLGAEGIIDASGQIADAVTGTGIDEWLDTVRGYHIGTFQHCMLVTGVAAAFASKSGMAQRDVMRITVAGLVHDIGKAAVPIEILDKPGALTDAEIAVIREHPVTGYNYLRARSAMTQEAIGAVRHHHEYLDGSGYPDRLVASQIDDVTRIITICDVYAALIERRSYKEPKTPEQAIGILNSMADAGKLEKSLVRQLGKIVMPS